MIDPIEMAEARNQIEGDMLTLRRRREAADALKWFSDYALSKPHGPPRSPIQGVLADQIKPVAHLTEGAETAARYLSRAFREHHRDIIKRAIELAQKDFDAG